MTSNEWEAFELGKLFDFKYGGLPKRNLINNPANFRIFTGYKFTDEQYPLYNCAKGQIILVARGVGGTGLIKFINEACWVTNLSIIFFQKSSLVFSQYIYYLYSVQNLRYLDSGSAQSQITIADIKNLSISIPPLQTQKRIAAILSALDEKIELNRQINQTLESIAQTIFTEWFVNFNYPGSTGDLIDSPLGPIPKGWEAGKLSDVATINMGQSPKGETYNYLGNGLEFFQGKAEFSFRFPTVNKFTSNPIKIANKFDTLLSVRAPVGAINMANINCCIGRGLASIEGLNNNWSFTYYLVLYLRPYFRAYENSGTVYGSINKTQIEQANIVIPMTRLIDQFESFANKIDRQILTLEQEIQTLTTLRDTLLPKLINGEIEV